jgi:hypothetical protein
VIKDFPFDKWNIKALTIANDMYSGGKKEENRNNIKSLMEQNGYILEREFSLIHLDKNKWSLLTGENILEDLYVKKDD